MTTSEKAVEGYFSTTSREFADLYRSRPEFRERYAVWTDFLDRYARGFKTALDLGCGSGIFSFYLGEKGLAVTGVDAADGMIALCESEKAARGTSRVNFVSAKIPVSGATILPGDVDLVISSSMLEYVADLGETLDFIRACVRDSGIVIVSMPNPRAVFRRLERWSFAILGRPSYLAFARQTASPESLARMFAERGFSQVETRYYAHAPLLSRALRMLHFPAVFTENLFVSVFRKNA